MNVDISVIIPVYNAGNHLNLCIESLLKQTLKTVEFIFVDDGSSDDSISLIKSYAEKDRRITLLKQNHLFAGTARNNGLKVAKGKYVIFLDSDDFFNRNLLLKAFKEAEKKRAQVVVFGYQPFDNCTKKRGRKCIPNLQSRPFSIKEYDNLFNRCYTMPWNKLFLKEFIIRNNIYFSGIKKSNDVFFVILSLSLADRIVGLRHSLVYYRQNNHLSSQGNKNADVNCAIDSRIEIKEELTKRGLFGGNVKTAFYKNANLIDYIFYGITDKNIMEFLYNYFKTYCIPFIFESEDLITSHLLRRCLYSDSFSDFIFELYRLEKERKKNDKYYLIGRFITFLPRKIIRIISKRRKAN